MFWSIIKPMVMAESIREKILLVHDIVFNGQHGWSWNTAWTKIGSAFGMEWFWFTEDYLLLIRFESFKTDDKSMFDNYFWLFEAFALFVLINIQTFIRIPLRCGRDGGIY